MTRTALIAAASTIAVALVWWSRSPEPRADFVFVNPSDIHTLDPARMSWTSDFRVALNLWEGLATMDARTAEPIAGAAEFPPERSPDGRTLTFHLRPDARWSNGDPVQASDFIRGWRRSMEPGTAADYIVLFADHIRGARGYVTWRTDGVRLLTALSRLAEGWPITDEQIGVIRDLPEVASYMATSVPPDHTSAPTNETPNRAWLDDATRAGMDWPAVHRAALTAHANEMDDRFAAVGFEAVDAHTLRVTLVEPCSYFGDLAASPPFLPCHESIERLRLGRDGLPLTAEGLVVYDPKWTKPSASTPDYPGLITNGPYSLGDWHFKRRARLVANVHYHSAADVRCLIVDMLVIPNVDAALIAYESGQIDLLPGLDVPYDHELARLAMSGERPDIKLLPTLATFFLNFNCLTAEVNGRPNPFVDRRVRRAFSLAIDRRIIVEEVLRRGDRVARSLVPPVSIPGYEPPLAPPPDPEAARQALVDAGYDSSNPLGPVELLYTTADERVCQAMARMWEETLGVRVELRSKESRTFANDKAARRYMISRGNWYADYNDPTTFLDILATDNGNNDSGYSNPAYDEKLSEARSELDPGKRAALLREAEAMIVAEDFPILPLLHPSTPVAIRPGVTGLYPNPRLWFPLSRAEVQR